MLGIELPEGCKVVAYADVLPPALMAVAQEVDQLVVMVEESIETIGEGMRVNRLSFAPEKQRR